MQFKLDERRFQHARLGDHLMLSFQCELCHFRNLQQRDPVVGSGKDSALMKFIKRANLDAFWSRESSTVARNWSHLHRMVMQSSALGLSPTYNLPPLGPTKVEDEIGMFLAVNLLYRSLDTGKNEPTVQFNTVRKMRSSYFNLWQASANSADAQTVAVRKAQKFEMTTSPSSRVWFERFTRGMHSRMGDKTCPDLAISIGVMLELMARFENRWCEGIANGWSDSDMEHILFPALFAVLAFMGGLRAEEVVLCDLVGMRKHHNMGTNHRDPTLRHTVIALLGRFKTETGEKYHLMPIALESRSGLKPAAWVDRMLVWYEKRTVIDGPVFRSSMGDRIKPVKLQPKIHEVLLEIQDDRPDLIPLHLDVTEEYAVGRSFRRGSNTQAINQKVDERDVDLNNRWRRFEAAAGRQPRLQMQQHYGDVMQMLPSLLRYSAAL